MNNRFQTAMASTVGVVPTQGTTLDLAIGQVGVYDTKTRKAATSLSNSVIIAQGQPLDRPTFAGFNNFSLRTPVIKAKNITGFTKKQAQRSKPIIYRFGFDGIDGALSVPITQESVSYQITSSGSVVAKLLGGASNADTPEYYEMVITAPLPPVTSCDTFSCSATHDENVVADAIIAAHNQRRFIGGAHLSEFIEAVKIVESASVSAQSFDKFTLTLVDGGGYQALAAVQAQYPGYGVVQVVSGLTSVYEVTVPSGQTPAAFDNSVTPVIPNCTNCPSGYTLLTSQDVYVVKKQLASTDNISNATAQAAYANAVKSAHSANAGVWGGTFAGVAFVTIYVNHGTAVSTLATETEVSALGTNVPICNLDTPTTIDWTAAGSCEKGIANFTLTIHNDDCNGSFLTELQNEYGDVTLVESANCVSKYLLPVLSDNYDCDDCVLEKFKYTTPKAFKGIGWVLETPDTTVTGHVGVEFRSVYEARQIAECWYKQVAYEYEPFIFVLSQVKNHEASGQQYPTIPTKLIQNLTFPVGVGAIVADTVATSNATKGMYWSCSPAERQAINYILGVDFQAYYDLYTIHYTGSNEETYSAGSAGNTQNTGYEALVWFKEGTGAAFEALFGQIAAKADVTLEIL
jgi:hypothetical protein